MIKQINKFNMRILLFFLDYNFYELLSDLLSKSLKLL